MSSGSIRTVIGIVLFLFVLPQIFSVRAFSYSLPVQPLSQRLMTPDANGDSGRKDCSAAVLTMALASLVLQEKMSDTGLLSYSTIRQLLRYRTPDVSKGIPLASLVSLTPIITNKQIVGEYRKVHQKSWESEVKLSLRAGYPVIVYLANWQILPQHTHDEASAHTLLLIGVTETTVTYVDPWDGRVFSLSLEDFERVWQRGQYRFSGVFFAKNESPSFTDIANRYFE